MVGKRFLAIVVAISMISSGTVSYAAEVTGTEESVSEVMEDSEEKATGANGEAETEVEQKTLFVSTDELLVNKGEDAFFHIVSSGTEGMTVEPEDQSIIEVIAVDEQEIEEAVKGDAPEGAEWYKVTGLAAGETSIKIWDESEEKVIAVTVNEGNPDDSGESAVGEEESESSTEEETDDEMMNEEDPLVGEETQEFAAEEMEPQNGAVVLAEPNAVGWKEEQDGTRYYFNDAGQFYTGIAEIEGVLYYFDDTTGYLCQTAQWIDKEGKKYFCNEEGVLYRNQLIKFDTTYYYMGNDGSVQKGVFSVGDDLRYADETTGVIQMTSGWITCGGKKFFADAEGILYQSQFIKFGDVYYYMGSDGSVQVGTFKVGSVWYHSNSSSGELKLDAGWIEDAGKKYYAKADGTIYVSQFISFGTTRYYMGADGSVQTGVIKVNGIVYYADTTSGKIQQEGGWIEYDGKKYFGKGDGTLYSNQLIKFGTTYYYMGSDGSVQKGIVNANGTLYYANPEDGVIQRTAGWIEYEGKKYFANETGVLYKNQFITFASDCYYMGSDGSVQKGRQYINGQWYYFDEETGLLERKPGWFTSGSNRYYQKSDGTLATGYTDIGGVRYYFNSSGALASRMGIDVSSWQGAINWSSVKAAGVEFVFIRAGYRGYSNGRLVKDTYFDQNVRGALAAGLDVGVYFFSQAITVAEAREEAAFVHNIIKNYDITYPVAFDAEYSGSSNRTGRADHLSPTTRTLMVNTFLSEIRNYGYTPMIYTGIYFMRDELQMSLLSNYQLWLARYNSTLGYDGAYKCWQYSSTGRVSGISGNVDMNVWLK